MSQFAQFQQQLEWLKTQVQCIQNGDCCGNILLTPLFDFNNATNILTSTFVDGTAIPVDLSSLAGVVGNLYTINGDIGTGRIASIVDTFTLADSTGAIPLNVFNTNGNTSLAMTAGTVSMGPVTVNNAKLHIQTTTADNTARAIQIDDSAGDLKHYRLNNGQVATGVNMIPNVVLRTGIHVEIDAITVGDSPLVIGERIIFTGGYTAAVLKSETAFRVDGLGHIEKAVVINSSRSVLGANLDHIGLLISAGTTVAVDTIAAHITASGEATQISTALQLTANSSTTNLALHVGSGDGHLLINSNALSANASQVEIEGDIELINIGDSLIFKRPDGTRVKLSVDNANALTAILA